MSSFIELEQDLWTVPADAVVVTTNGFVKKNGEAVMGRGCALEAQRFLPPKLFGARLLRRGNRVQLFKDCIENMYGQRVDLVTFPVKHNWYEAADLELISRSAKELHQLADCMDWERVVMPRPGCGNGGLAWAAVRPVLWQHFDSRFTVVTFPGEEPEEEEVYI